MEEFNVEYQPPQKIYWSGRKSNPDKENQYWHQEIKLFHLDEIGKENVDYAILGYVCDEGVRRNRGRVGANEGPIAFRERLAKLPIHFEQKEVADVGNIICIDDDLESCQQAFANTIKKIISNNIFPIAIGGGHDMAYAHFKGIYEAINNPNKKIGIINFDAHFDLRPVENKVNSGTPFHQILKEYDNVEYFAIGIQQQSNTKELFNIAKKLQVQYVLNYDCESSKEEINNLKDRLTPFINKVDYIYVTLDMDGFSSAYAPGVSAPSPLGFTPYFVFKMLSFLFESNKIIAFDIAELNPTLDRDSVTSTLAAKVVDYIVSIISNE